MSKIRKVVKSILKKKRGGGVPPEKVFFEGADKAYDAKAPPAIGDGQYVKILDTPTFDAYLRQSDKSILLASRGTALNSWNDLKADAFLLANRLKQTKRYATDVNALRAVVAKYPPEQGYEYYIAGHSLAVAIANQLMRDFPFIRYAVGYNGAFQSFDLQNQLPNIKRLYTDKDFLYNLGGKFFRGVKVIPFQEQTAQGFFGRIKSALTPSGIKGHTINNFKKLYGGAGDEIEEHKGDTESESEESEVSESDSDYSVVNAGNVNQAIAQLNEWLESLLEPDWNVDEMEHNDLAWNAIRDDLVELYMRISEYFRNNNINWEWVVVGDDGEEVVDLQMIEDLENPFEEAPEEMGEEEQFHQEGDDAESDSDESFDSDNGRRMIERKTGEGFNFKGKGSMSKIRKVVKSILQKKKGGCACMEGNGGTPSRPIQTRREYTLADVGDAEKRSLLLNHHKQTSKIRDLKADEVVIPESVFNTIEETPISEMRKFYATEIVEDWGKKKGRGKSVKMPLKSFTKEHKKLIKILEKGSVKERKQEAKEQKAELAKYKGGMRGRRSISRPRDEDRNPLPASRQPVRRGRPLRPPRSPSPVSSPSPSPSPRPRSPPSPALTAIEPENTPPAYRTLRQALFDFYEGFDAHAETLRDRWIRRFESRERGDDMRRNAQYTSEGGFLTFFRGDLERAVLPIHRDMGYALDRGELTRALYSDLAEYNNRLLNDLMTHLGEYNETLVMSANRYLTDMREEDEARARNQAEWDELEAEMSNIPIHPADRVGYDGEEESKEGNGRYTKKSGYIASLITCKNKPMTLSKFKNQSDGFKNYTSKKLGSYPSCDDMDSRWKEYLASLPNARAKATARQRLRYYTSGVEREAISRNDAIKLILDKYQSRPTTNTRGRTNPFVSRYLEAVAPAEEEELPNIRTPATNDKRQIRKNAYNQAHRFLLSKGGASAEEYDRVAKRIYDVIIEQKGLTEGGDYEFKYGVNRYGAVEAGKKKPTP